MQNLLYIFAVMMVVLWGLGFFIYNAGGLIHILLLIAVVAIILRIIKEKHI